MIDVNKFFSVLKKNNIDFFCGVPDSILKKTNSHFSNFKKENHIILHNEGGAVATAAGYALRTKKIPCVYLQNSGLGNIVNPVLSLVHKKVYSIPILFLIGWRGSPGKKGAQTQKNRSGSSYPGSKKDRNILSKVAKSVSSSNRRLAFQEKLKT